MKKKKIIAFVVLISVLLIFFVSRKKDKQYIVSTDIAKPDHIVATLMQTGVIKPKVGALVAVGARTTGVLDSVNVKVGDKVKKGQLLAKIDSRSIRESISQSEDSLKKAEIELSNQKNVFPIRESIQKNLIESQESNYKYFNALYEREKILYEKGYSRKETLEKAEHDMITAEKEYINQKLQLAFMQKEYQSNIASLNFEVSRQKAILNEQKINLTYTEIFATIDGVVSNVNSVEGETIVAGLEVAKLITLFRPELLEMHIYVDESDVSKIKEGMIVYYSVDTYQDKEFTGKVSRINFEPEKKDGVTYYVAIVDIDEKDALTLRPDMTSNVKIIWEEKDAPVTLSTSSIKWENGERVVYKVIDKALNKTEIVPVTLGLRGENRVEVLSGISEAEEVVIKFGDKQEMSMKNAK